MGVDECVTVNVTRAFHRPLGLPRGRDRARGARAIADEDEGGGGMRRVARGIIMNNVASKGARIAYRDTFRLFVP